MSQELVQVVNVYHRHTSDKNKILMPRLAYWYNDSYSSFGRHLRTCSAQPANKQYASLLVLPKQQQTEQKKQELTKAKTGTAPIRQGSGKSLPPPRSIDPVKDAGPDSEDTSQNSISLSVGSYQASFSNPHENIMPIIEDKLLRKGHEWPYNNEVHQTSTSPSSGLQ
jgi:hypothetical protein